jgi:hypothetical protein
MEPLSILVGNDEAVQAIKEKLEGITARYLFHLCPTTTTTTITTTTNNNNNPFLQAFHSLHNNKKLLTNTKLTIVICIKDFHELRHVFLLTEIFRSYQTHLFLCLSHMNIKMLTTQLSNQHAVECQTLLWFLGRTFSAMENEKPPTDLLRSLVRASKCTTSCNNILPLDTISHIDHITICTKRALAKEKFMEDQLSDSRQAQVLWNRFESQLGLTTVI